MPAGPAGPGLDRSDIPAPQPGRPLWTIFGTILVVAGLGWGAFNVLDLLAHGETSESATFAAAGIETVDVSVDNGHVLILGTDTDEIRLQADISHGLRDTGYRWEVVEGRLEVDASCPLFGSYWCEVDYRLEVPSDVDVVINADNDRVYVRDVDGDVHIDNDNGRIELVGLSGTVEADTDNGRIEGDGLSSPSARISSNNGRIELVFEEPPSYVEARTDNGSIDIALPPADDGYTVHTDTDNGREDVTAPVNRASGRTVIATTRNGSVTVRPLG